MKKIKLLAGVSLLALSVALGACDSDEPVANNTTVVEHNTTVVDRDAANDAQAN